MDGAVHTHDSLPTTVVRVQPWRGLLWREWLAHRGVVIHALAAWLACAWVLLIFFHPGFIIAFGVIYAFVAGTVFGGADAAEGSEEFAFALPPTRSERYVARLAIGGGTVAGFCLLGVASIALDLPQRLWALVVETGFTEPFPVCEMPSLYLLAVAVPLAVYAFGFAIAAVAGSRGLVAVSWLFAGAAAGAVVGAGCIVEALLWQTVHGWAVAVVLLALAPLGLLLGYFGYVRKEGVSRPTPMQGRSSWWIVFLVLGVVLLLLFLMYFMVSGDRRPSVADDTPTRVSQPPVPVPRRAVEPERMPAPPPTVAEPPKGGGR